MITSKKAGWSNQTMRRYGFGNETGRTEVGDKPQFEHGHVEVSEKASKFATQQYMRESPAGAVGLELARVGGVDLSEYADLTPDAEAVKEAVTEVDGVGEETAGEIAEAVTEAL